MTDGDDDPLELPWTTEIGDGRHRFTGGSFNEWLGLTVESVGAGEATIAV